MGNVIHMVHTQINNRISTSTGNIRDTVCYRDRVQVPVTYGIPCVTGTVNREVTVADYSNIRNSNIRTHYSCLLLAAFCVSLIVRRNFNAT